MPGRPLARPLDSPDGLRADERARQLDLAQVGHAVGEPDLTEALNDRHVAERLHRHDGVEEIGRGRSEELLGARPHLGHVLAEERDVADAQRVSVRRGHAGALGRRGHAELVRIAAFHPDGRPAVLDHPANDIVLGANVVPDTPADGIGRRVATGHRVELLGREIGQRLVEARVHALELGANEVHCAEHVRLLAWGSPLGAAVSRPIIAQGACGSDRSCRSLPPMKITQIESLHADAGWRNFDFLKISTDEGITGWSEYNENFGGPGLSRVIDELGSALIGKDPRAWEAHVALMYALRRQASGGVIQQAIGAIENALLDVKARALGVPVHELFGGPVRDRVRLYWSHCATYRVNRAKEMQVPPVRTLADIVALGREVVAKGYTALKTNVLILGDNPRGHVPGFARGEGFPALNADRYVIDAARDLLAAFREGAGARMDILVDLNFNYKTEGFLKLARAMEPYDLFWVEIDTRELQ